MLFLENKYEVNEVLVPTVLPSCSLSCYRFGLSVIEGLAGKSVGGLDYDGVHVASI